MRSIFFHWFIRFLALFMSFADFSFSQTKNKQTDAMGPPETPDELQTLEDAKIVFKKRCKVRIKTTSNLQLGDTIYFVKMQNQYIPATVKKFFEKKGVYLVKINPPNCRKNLKKSEISIAASEGGGGEGGFLPAHQNWAISIELAPLTSVTDNSNSIVDDSGGSTESEGSTVEPTYSALHYGLGARKIFGSGPYRYPLDLGIKMRFLGLAIESSGITAIASADTTMLYFSSGAIFATSSFHFGGLLEYDYGLSGSFKVSIGGLSSSASITSSSYIGLRLPFLYVLGSNSLIGIEINYGNYELKIEGASSSGKFTYSGAALRFDYHF